MKRDWITSAIWLRVLLSLMLAGGVVVLGLGAWGASRGGHYGPATLTALGASIIVASCVGLWAVQHKKTRAILALTIFVALITAVEFAIAVLTVYEWFRVGDRIRLFKEHDPGRYAQVFQDKSPEQAAKTVSGHLEALGGVALAFVVVQTFAIVLMALYRRSILSGRTYANASSDIAMKDNTPNSMFKVVPDI
eukprot:CAMPEP_0184656590 /NCGR_PEP_ID=MMETSP0308-20130426/16609_1 /TAXON_ID=38269 /ORGANISM="Gloeochaete witrockiana, Strain SAG 46.84" /LENGTH=192 /DNA_ID=CAMNT_0027093777 /DNA_START=130 /DNA_END=708 /DNA_ORIENTATION=-